MYLAQILRATRGLLSGPYVPVAESGTQTAVVAEQDRNPKSNRIAGTEGHTTSSVYFEVEV